jgi:hypothetical protein
MKIQEVIDEVNEAWGEEHEEKKKQIYWENIVRKPLKLFRNISFCYIVLGIVFLVMYSTKPNEVRQFFLDFISSIFNIPYYLLDVRSSIIASLASLLLSLYISVGKFADNIEGIIGEARRAVYRQFAKIVSGIVFVILIINFWYGLLAGYFQGSSNAPSILGPWSVGPGWGRLIVPEYINLSRYGEIPQWVLLFFAWFTLSSSLMLTYNEKSILIKNSLFLNRLKGVDATGKSTYGTEYEIARYEFEYGGPKKSYEASDGLKTPDGLNRGKNETVYCSSVLKFGERYSSFPINVSIQSYILNMHFLKVFIPWATVCILSLMFLGKDGIEFSITLTAFYCLYWFMVVGNSYSLISEIYKLNILYLNRGYRRAFEYISFYWVVWGNRVIAFIAALASLMVLVNRYVREISDLINGLNLSDGISMAVFIAGILIVALIVTCISVIIVENSVRGSLRENIKRKSGPILVNNFKFSALVCREREKIDFIMVAYIYYLMWIASDIYSKYKSELGEGKSEI